MILPFKTIHDSAEPLGFLLQSGPPDVEGVKVLYAIDTQYIPNRFKGLTHIAIEVNYDLLILKENIKRGSVDLDLAKNIIQGHMSLETAKEFFRVNDMSKVQEIHLLHLSNQNSNAGLFREEIMRISGRPTYIGG